MKLEERIDYVQTVGLNTDDKVIVKLCENANQLHHVATKAMDLHLAISVFLQDYKDGDFELPKLAQIHLREIRRKYTDMGKALYPIQLEL